MQDNTMKTKTKRTKNQMNKYSTAIHTALLQAACVPNSALVLTYPGQKKKKKKENLHMQISWKLADTNDTKDICFVAAFTCGFNPRKKIT